jgi:DUF1680 family protein
MDRRKFVKSAVLAPLAVAGGERAFAVANGGNPALMADSAATGGPSDARQGQMIAGEPIGNRLTLTMSRIKLGRSPEFTDEFILDDLRPAAGRRFTEYSGDVSGRYIGAMATAAKIHKTHSPELDQLVGKAIALQKPDGYFGSGFHYDKPNDLDMALLWGNGRLLVGLVEYYRIAPSPAVLAACTRLGDFLVRVGPLMLSREIRDGFGAQHFASSYICWTQQVEGLANLYQVTKDERYRKLAEETVAVTERRAGDHVHGYLTSVRGWVDLYNATGDRELLGKCEAAWEDVAQSRDLLITGGVPEGWSPNNHRTEGCGEADWTRLSMALWRATGKSRYLEMAERTTLNELAFNQYESGDFGHRVFTDTGLPAGGAVKAWWCCTLHGLRCFPDIQATVFRAGDGGVSFDLPLDGRIETPELSASSESFLGQDGTVRITVQSAGNAAAEVSIRKPKWSGDPLIRINDALGNFPTEDGYARIRRIWQPGDVIQVKYAMELRPEAAGANRTAYFFGPWLLGAPASENPAYFNELTLENRLAGLESGSPGNLTAPATSAVFRVPIAGTAFHFVPAEYPEQPGRVVLRPIAEQTGQATTSWELRFLTRATS